MRIVHTCLVTKPRASHSWNSQVAIHRGMSTTSSHGSRHAARGDAGKLETGSREMKNAQLLVK